MGRLDTFKSCYKSSVIQFVVVVFMIIVDDVVPRLMPYFIWLIMLEIITHPTTDGWRADVWITAQGRHLVTV